jgi:hypothetical protein
MAAAPAPYAVFGYAYALERLAAGVTPAHVAAIQALVPAGLDVTRSRRVHSGAGSERDHVRDLVEFVGALPDAARDRVAVAIRETVPRVIAVALDPAPRVALAAWLGCRSHKMNHQ